VSAPCCGRLERKSDGKLVAHGTTTCMILAPARVGPVSLHQLGGPGRRRLVGHHQQAH